MTKVFSGTLSPFSSVVSVVKIWDFSISASAYSPPGPLSLLCVCSRWGFINKAHSQDDEVTTSGLAVTPQRQIKWQEARFMCHFYCVRQRNSDINGL